MRFFVEGVLDVFAMEMGMGAVHYVTHQEDPLSHLAVCGKGDDDHVSFVVKGELACRVGEIALLSVVAPNVERSAYYTVLGVREQGGSKWVVLFPICQAAKSAPQVDVDQGKAHNALWKAFEAAPEAVVCVDFHPAGLMVGENL